MTVIDASKGCHGALVETVKTMEEIWHVNSEIDGLEKSLDIICKNPMIAPNALSLLDEDMRRIKFLSTVLSTGQPA